MNARVRLDTTTGPRRGLLACLMVIALVAVAASPVGAASWYVQAQGDCYNSTPKGANWIHWEGYASSTYGESWGWLYHLEGGSWIKRSTGYADGSGGTNNAVANTRASYQGGYWQNSGKHYLNHDYRDSSYSPRWSCPP